MAVTPLQKKKIQRFLILALLLVMFVTATVIWWGFFRTSPTSEESALPPARKVEVDTRILQHPIFEELDEPRAKIQIPSEIGRDNPLLPSP